MPFVQAVEAMKLKVGYSVKLTEITPEKMIYAKSVGLDFIEISGFNALYDTERNLVSDENEVKKLILAIKKAVDEAGIKVWSIHMPFGQHIDLSQPNELVRRETVALHKQVLSFCKVLEPNVLLFHPSYFLGKNERDIRKEQLIRSVDELNLVVQNMNGNMVIENMLGDRLKKGKTQENPLCRTVQETQEIMSLLPHTVGAAIDMNHIKNPEKLISSMGERLITVHIADGDGKQECHYFPCSGNGKNNWNKILKALDKAGYNGPFMYECAYGDEKDLTDCYNSMFQKAYNKHLN